MSATHSGTVSAPNRSHFLDIVFARDDPWSLSLGVGGGGGADDDDDDARTIARPRRPRRPTTARTPPATATDVVMSRRAMTTKETDAGTDGRRRVGVV